MHPTPISFLTIICNGDDLQQFNGTNGSKSSGDPRVEELLAAVQSLQTQNAEQEHRNEERRFRSQILETRERQLHEQLTDMRRFAQALEATRTS